MSERIEMLEKQKEEGDQKLYILAQKIEEYRGEEDTLKTALLNAQRMGENVIREAKQKAESILREANIKADDLTRDAREQIVEYNLELERVQAEVAHFKATVLGLYRQHIESLTTLPGEEEEPEPQHEQPVQEEPAPQPAPCVPEEPVPAAPTQTPEPEEPAQPKFVPEEFAQTMEPSEPPQEAVHSESDTIDFSADLAAAQAQQKSEEEEPLPNLFSGFQGIKFSD